MATWRFRQMIEHDNRRAILQVRRGGGGAAGGRAGAGGGGGGRPAEPQARSFRQAFPVTPGVSLRLGNLAGRVELVGGAGNQVVIDAEVHAELPGSGETQRVLQEMKWVRSRSEEGREEWDLSYPVERYRSYFYPQPHEGAESSFWSLL